MVLILFACVGLAGCGSVVQSNSSSGTGSVPAITSFTADPTSINSGASSTLSWVTTGATSIAITPGTFTSTSASGSTSVSPTATTTYTLTATNAAGSTTSTLTVTVNAAKQTNHQLFHSEPHKYHFGLQQHAELGDDRRDQYCHHAGDIHVHIGEWFDEREPNGDDHLHADGYQCRRLDHGHGKSHGNSVRRSIDDHNHFVPRRNPRRGVCRLHNSRQRRLSALHLFRKHEFHDYPPLPEGMSLNATTGNISSSLIGGQGTYTPEFVVTDSTGAQATQEHQLRHQRQQRVPRQHLSVNFDFSPSSGRGHDRLARGYFSRGAYVQRLFAGDGQAILRKQCVCYLSQRNTGH